jgi:hypothetical protein
MSQTSIDPAQAHPNNSETPEPTDNNSYRILAISFLVGMIVIIVFFTTMLVLLAGAAR